jgi:hypothetical protein
VNSKHPFALLDVKDDGTEGSDGTTDDKSEGTHGKVQGCSAKYDVASVVTHEIGHFFGLGEDMTDSNATMYYSTPFCNVVKRHLKTDDVKAISSLYVADLPVEKSSAGGVGHCAVSAPGRDGSGGGLAFVGVAISLLAVGRRRRATTAS